MTTHKYHLFLNVHSGSVATAGVTGEVLEAAFAGIGLDVHVDADPDASFEARIARAIDSDASVVIAAGGDGTVTALAEALVGTGKILGILPLGTANLLARDLSIPLDVGQWVEALEGMEPHSIDVGYVNGRIFLHKVVLGVLPALAAGRERIRGEGGAAVFGFLRYLTRRLERARRIALKVTVDNAQPRLERLSALAVASNAYDEGIGQFFSRSRLDSGKLTIYRMRHLTLGDMLRLTVSMVAGNWQHDEALDIQDAHSVTIETRKPAVKVMLDGEVETLQSPLEFTLLHRGLPVLAPPRASTLDPTEDALQAITER